MTAIPGPIPILPMVPGNGPDPAELAGLRRRIASLLDDATELATALREWSRQLAVYALQLRELAGQLDTAAGEVTPALVDDDDGEL
jgi:hypothetical protein